jgi:hypothetical protein
MISHASFDRQLNPITVMYNAAVETELVILFHPQDALPACQYALA